MLLFGVYRNGRECLVQLCGLRKEARAAQETDIVVTKSLFRGEGSDSILTKSWGLVGGSGLCPGEFPRLVALSESCIKHQRGNLPLCKILVLHLCQAFPSL